MIPIIEHEVVEKNNWLKSEDILEIIAISESTPGPIAINSATFVGYRIAGFFGAFFASLAVVLPSFVIISIISGILAKFEALQVVQYAFLGIRAGVVALVLKAFWTMYKKCDKSPFSLCIAGLAFILSAILSINVLYVIIACAVLGFCYSCIFKGGKKE